MTNKIKKKVLVLGGDGMLGSMCVRVLSQNPYIELGVTKRKGCPSKEDKYHCIPHDVKFLPPNFQNFDYIINCIGVIKSRINENDPNNVMDSIYINSYFPYLLSQLNLKSTIIQICSDETLKSTSNQQLDESLVMDGTSVYAKTKSLGEVKTKNIYNLRCSLVGPEEKSHKSLLDWFLAQNNEIKGYTNHLWNGITSLAFAKICNSIIVNELKLPNVHHLIPANSCSKYELLKTFSKYFDKKIDIMPNVAQISVDRKLKTLNEPLNTLLWKSAGYNEVPIIDYLIWELAEFIKNDIPKTVKWPDSTE